MTKALITTGENPYYLVSGDLMRNLTLQSEIEGENSDNERIITSPSSSPISIEAFCVVAEVLKDIYRFYAPNDILNFAKLAERTLCKYEEERRNNNEEWVARPCGVSLQVEINLRDIWKRLHRGAKPSSTKLREFSGLFREISNTSQSFIVPVSSRGGLITAQAKEPLFTMPPLRVELSTPEEIKNNKRSYQKESSPYTAVISVSAMAVFRLGEQFIKLPSDIADRLTQANKRNTIFNALLWPILSLSMYKAKVCKTYLDKIKDNRNSKKDPHKCDFTIQQINVFLCGKEVRSNKFEPLLIAAFDTLKNIVRVIHSYKIKKSAEGNKEKIIGVEFTLNSQFLKQSNITGQPQEASL